LAFCNPLGLGKRARSGIRRRATAIGASLIYLVWAATPSYAQGIDIIRDTEIERVLHSYEDPFLKAAGLDPHAVKIYLVNDSSVNSFAAEGQNIFIQTGMILYVKSPDELKGVMAHETGHIAGGHLIRDVSAMNKSMIPMLIGLVAGAAAMAAGAGEAGMGVMMAGEQVGEAQFLEFSRAQEATADQMGMKYLTAAHESGRGMLAVFERMADEAAMTADPQRSNPYASDHPLDRERVALLQSLVEASPYRDVQDTPAEIHEFQMIQAKLAGYLSKPAAVLRRWPPSDTSEPARYARAMAYFRQPDLQKALVETNSLIAEEPNNPYFHELLGQIYVEMAQPQKGVAPYQKAVDLLPDAPLLRISLAQAEIATEDPKNYKLALDNLKIALQQEDDNDFGWYEAAEAYSRMGNEPMADLSTAERYFADGQMKPAGMFAMRAAHGLTKGSSDWQRASDIAAAASTDSSNKQ